LLVVRLMEFVHHHHAERDWFVLVFEGVEEAGFWRFCMRKTVCALVKDF